MSLSTWQWAMFGALLLAGLLLAAGALPPNRWLGLRTTRTLGSRGDWDRAHRALGLVTLGGATAGLLLNALALHPLFQAVAGVFAMVGAAGLYAIVHRRYAV